MIRARVIGAGGFGGANIIELLTAHPEAEIVSLVDRPGSGPAHQCPAHPPEGHLRPDGFGPRRRALGWFDRSGLHRHPRRRGDDPGRGLPRGRRADDRLQRRLPLQQRRGLRLLRRADRARSGPCGRRAAAPVGLRPDRAASGRDRGDIPGGQPGVLRRFGHPGRGSGGAGRPDRSGHPHLRRQDGGLRRRNQAGADLPLSAALREHERLQDRRASAQFRDGTGAVLHWPAPSCG